MPGPTYTLLQNAPHIFLGFSEISVSEGKPERNQFEDHKMGMKGL